MPEPGSASQGAATPHQVVEHFFRHETGRLHAILLRLLGPGQIALAEDVVQTALLRAMKAWAIGGIPDNPSGWITRVALNAARDELRHRRMSSDKEQAIVTFLDQTRSESKVQTGDAQGIRDDTLRLLLVCCHPALSLDSQAVLALKILCGFSTAEIARGFLSSEAAIEKQLTRTKNRIQDLNIPMELPSGAELEDRIAGALATLYLLFNEGYKASSGDRLVREDLCSEALRLTRLLLGNPAGDTPGARALLSLMLLTSARFPARVDVDGDLVRLDEQDRSRWDAKKIDEGLLLLAQSSTGTRLSPYHLQAAIAAAHALASDAGSTDWRRIANYYETLQKLQPSPVVELNRAVALSRSEGPEAGLALLDSMKGREVVERDYLYHAVRGDLLGVVGRHREAAESFRRALDLARVGPEQGYLAKRLALLEAGD